MRCNDPCGRYPVRGGGQSLTSSANAATSDSVTASWTYSAEAGTITDGDWVLGVKTDTKTLSNGLSVTSLVSQSEGATVLDFSKSVTDTEGSEFCVVKVEQNVFKENTTLAELYLPDGFYEFGANSFQNCTSLKTVSPLFPDSIRTIGSYAFEYCPIEGDMRIGFGTDTVNVTFGGYYCLRENYFTTMTFGPRCKDLGNWSFCNSKALKQVVFSDSVNRIGSGAFNDCGTVTSLTPCLPTSLKSIDTYSFRNMKSCRGTLELCNGDYSYNIPNDAFNNTGFDEIVFGAKFAGTIGARTFQNMPNLQHIRVLCDANFNFTSDEIFDDRPYQVIVHVPADNESWQTVLGDVTQVKPWASLDADTKAKFTEYFPDENRPKGLIVATWSTDATVSGTKKTLVNRWITDDTAAEVQVIVGGSPVEAGTPSLPYGITKPSAYPVTCTMTETAASGATLYRTTGYTAAYVDEDGNAVRESETSSALTFTYDGSLGCNVILTWNFEPIAYKAALSYPQTGAYSVTVETTADYDGGYFEPGKSVTYTAVGEGFVRWFGDIGDADPTARSITVTLDQAKTLKPYFPSTWTLSENGATLTDSYWTLAVSGSSDSLTVNGYTGDPIAYLDFSKAMPDGVAIVAFGEKAFYQTTALEELYLPETVKDFGWQSFASCTSLKKVSPLFPDSVKFFNHEAFADSPIEGDVRLGFGTADVGFGWYNHFRGNRFTTVTLGSHCKKLGYATFSGSTSLTEVTLSEACESFDQYSFANCSAVTSFTPCLPTGLKSLGGNALRGLSSLRGTVEICNGENAYALPASCFYGSGFDEIVFGAKFVGVISENDIFREMPNFRRIRFLGDFNLDFTQTGSVFDDNPYGMIVSVPNPEDNASWKAVLEDAEQVTPWASLDAERKAKYRENFPGVKNPKGLIIADWSTTGVSGTTKTLVNRWVTYDGNPGLVIRIR